MDEDTLEFLKEHEEKIGSKILWKTYATFYGEINGNKREYGVFLYTDGINLYYEDFYRPPMLLGIPLRKRKSADYTKMEGLIPIEEIESITLVTQSSAIKSLRDCKDKSKKANPFDRALRKLFSRIETNRGRIYFMEIIEPKKFADMVFNYKKEINNGSIQGV